jgi:hypothetical protein
MNFGVKFDLIFDYYYVKLKFNLLNLAFKFSHHT